jgi:hypothetical protein
MSDYFYDGQIKRYITQFMRVFSNFSYKDAKGQLVRVPVRYGDMSRQVGSILAQNSENSIPSAPFMSCYITDLKFDQSRMQDPTFVSTVNIRQREYIDTEQGREFLNTQGQNYTVERLMPTPYLGTFVTDLWTTNTDQKLQIWEQISVLFNPSLELQTTDNYIDWTSISVLTLTGTKWTSRTIPQGTNQDIDILSMSFETYIWITPPVKVKKLGIITKIIANVFDAGLDNLSELNSDVVFNSISPGNSKVVVTSGNFGLLILNNEAKLLPQSYINEQEKFNKIDNNIPWTRLLDLYPGKFRAGLSQLRLMTPNNTEIVAYLSLDPLDETVMNLNFDADTIPTNTIITGTVLPRGTVDAIIDPEKFNPSSPSVGIRYLILENLNSSYSVPGYDGPDAWKNADNSDPVASANDIIEWDGSQWQVIFNSKTISSVVYITNTYTGIQYKWTNGEWTKSSEGIYDRELWRLVL